MANQRHLKKENFARRFTDTFSDFFHLSTTQVVCIGFVAGLLIFLSTFNCLGWESFLQPQTAGEASSIVIVRFGFPFESLRKVLTPETYSIPVGPYSGLWRNITFMEPNFEIVWLGLIADLVVYSLPLIVIVKVVIRIKDEIDYRRYDKK